MSYDKFQSSKSERAPLLQSMHDGRGQQQPPSVLGPTAPSLNASGSMAGGVARGPVLGHRDSFGPNPGMLNLPEDSPHYEDTPSYQTLADASLLCTQYRRNDVARIFTGTDFQANSSLSEIQIQKWYWCYYCLPCVCGPLYHCTHVNLHVEPQHVGLLMDDKNNYMFAQPGIHNHFTCCGQLQVSKDRTKRLRGHITHGNRTIVIIEQGYIGYATDNGQPVLLPPGIHVWTSESLDYVQSLPLDQPIVKLGPYTLVTVDEGYAAVTQDNGKQKILDGGGTHLLTHKNWK
jgi:hypothetical protein